jgi:hypothetical protein
VDFCTFKFNLPVLDHDGRWQRVVLCARRRSWRRTSQHQHAIIVGLELGASGCAFGGASGPGRAWTLGLNLKPRLLAFADGRSVYPLGGSFEYDPSHLTPLGWTAATTRILISTELAR